MPMEGDFMGDGDMPQPPQDNNQVKYFSHRNFFNLCETALTFLISGCGLVWHGPLDYAPVSKTSNVGLGKALFISYLSNQWKGLRLNFSPEKFSSEPFLYRFSLQLLSWYMNVPNLWTDSLVEFPWNCLNFFGILQVEYSVICCWWFLPQIMLQGGKHSLKVLWAALASDLWYEMFCWGRDL